MTWCLLYYALAPARAEGLPPAPDPAAISAADDARARELFENGALLYDEGRYEDAIVAWQESWRLSGRPLLLFNMANAAERLGRWNDAMDLLSRYRALAPADERETLDRRIGNIERRIEELDARPLPAPPGAAASTIPSASGSPAPSSGSAATLPTRPPRIVPIALLTAGSLSVVTGTVFAFRALDARADAGALCVPRNGEHWCPESAATALATDRQSALVADVTIGVGLGALGGGLLGLLLPARRDVRVSLDVRGDGGTVRLAAALP